MRAAEFTTEAHHSILKVIQMGPWRVHIDTHAIVSATARSVDVADFSNIVSYATHVPNTLNTIPVGKGAYFQDVNTMISIYIHRLSEDELRVETVLGPDMRPTQPMFRRPVPPHNRKVDPRLKQSQDAMRKQTQQHGRDTISQRLADIKPIVNMNRSDRRAFKRMVKKK